MSAKLEALIAAKRAYENMVKAEAKNILREVFNDFFDSHPEVSAVHWSQYTPYFNDGEPCVFNVNDPYYKFASFEEAQKVCKPGYKKEVFDLEEYENGGDRDNGFFSPWNLKEEASGNYKLGSVLCDHLEDVSKNAFGDHVEVTATREGFVVEDYEHE